MTITTDTVFTEVTVTDGSVTRVYDDGRVERIAVTPPAWSEPPCLHPLAIARPGEYVVKCAWCDEVLE